MATKKKSSPVADNVFISENGRKIKLQKADPIFMSAVINSVKFPEVPKYEARTAHGNVEYHDMDEESAEQTPGGEDIWKNYQKELTAATSEQNEVSLRAMFLEGTIRPEKDYLDSGWVKRMRIVKAGIPEEPDEAWVFYLMSSLTPTDIAGLASKIMRMTGVDEDIIQEAEDSFRDSVLDIAAEDEVADAE